MSDDLKPLQTKTGIPHPSEYVREEMEARGWTMHDLAVRMTLHDFEVNQLALEMYFAVGPTDAHAHVGDTMDAQLCRAFGVSQGFFTRLEKAWRDGLEVESPKVVSLMDALKRALPKSDGAA